MASRRKTLMIFQSGDNARTAFWDSAADVKFDREQFVVVTSKPRTMDDAALFAEARIAEHVATVGMVRVVDATYDGWLIFGTLA